MSKKEKKAREDEAKKATRDAIQNGGKNNKNKNKNKNGKGNGSGSDGEKKDGQGETGVAQTN